MGALSWFVCVQVWKETILREGLEDWAKEEQKLKRRVETEYQNQEDPNTWDLN